MKSFLSVAAAVLAISPEFSVAQLSSVPKRLRASHPSPKTSEEWGRHHRKNVISSTDPTEHDRRQRELMSVTRSLEESMSMSISYSLSMITEVEDIVDEVDSEESTSEVAPEIPEESEPTDPKPDEEEPEIADVLPTTPPETAEEPNDKEDDESVTEGESIVETEEEEELDGEFVDQELSNSATTVFVTSFALTISCALWAMVM
mmetsp:Transcript_28950/g.58416  ORF Transcript_28950/g.58416 Transcript_28950/m.58416 type:complete len:204 (+) Transcript_28950:93-704(+)